MAVFCEFMAAFHQSSRSQTWSKTQVFDQVCDKFVRVADLVANKFATFRVENLVANLLDLSRHVEIDLAGSRQVRWVRSGCRPARAMECRNDTTQRTQRTQRTCPRRLLLLILTHKVFIVTSLNFQLCHLLEIYIKT